MHYLGLFKRNEMNIFFVFSACLWSWLVGRAIAFGPKCSIITWVPNLGPDSWYALTPIRGKMPVALVKLAPIIFTAISVPTLFVNNTITHSIIVFMLVSEQCYIPIFATRIYDGIPQWPAIQIIIYVLFALTLKNNIIVITIAMKIALWTWFLWTEFTIKNKIVREELVYTERQPRTV